MNSIEKKRAVFGWIMYDWANSAFATTIMAAVLPIFYANVAAQGLAPHLKTSFWGYTQSISTIIVAVLGPIMGAISDYSNSKSKFLKFFCYMGIISTILLYFIKTGDYILCSLLYIVGSIGFSGSLAFYDAFLPDIADESDMNWISSKGYAVGYIGGGLLLVINLLMIQKPHIFLIPDTLTATRLSFVTVGIWWFVFSIPLFKYVKDKRTKSIPIKLDVFHIAYERLSRTVREISTYKQLAVFLLAFLLYNDGIGTIIKMATIYGSEIGIEDTSLIGALLLTQFVAFPFALIFGKLPEKIGTKQSLYICLGVYIIISIWGYFMNSARDFWMLAFLVGTVQGGSQALSRSLFGIMVPKSRAAEFFSFFSISDKFASILGPFVFAVVGQLTGSSRLGIISLVVFFIAGAILLASVDIEKGKLAAQE